MRRFFLILGILTCCTLAYANYRGWVVLNSVFPRTWEHKEPGKPGIFHK